MLFYLHNEMALQNNYKPIKNQFNKYIDLNLQNTKINKFETHLSSSSGSQAE